MERGPDRGSCSRQACRPAAGRLARLKATFGDRAYCALTRRFRPDDAAHLHGVATIASQARVPTVVTNDVLYHQPDRRMLQDVVTCIRLKTIDRQCGLPQEKACRPLPQRRPPRWRACSAAIPNAVARTLEIAERCRFSLDELTYTYPTEGRTTG